MTQPGLSINVSEDAAKTEIDHLRYPAAKGSVEVV